MCTWGVVSNFVVLPWAHGGLWWPGQVTWFRGHLIEKCLDQGASFGPNRTSGYLVSKKHALNTLRLYFYTLTVCGCFGVVR